MQSGISMQEEKIETPVEACRASIVFVLIVIRNDIWPSKHDKIQSPHHHRMSAGGCIAFQFTGSWLTRQISLIA